METHKLHTKSASGPAVAGMPSVSRIATLAVFIEPNMNPKFHDEMTASPAAVSSGIGSRTSMRTTLSSSPSSSKAEPISSRDLDTEKLRDTREDRPGSARGARSNSGDSGMSLNSLSEVLCRRSKD